MRNEFSHNSFVDPSKTSRGTSGESVMYMIRNASMQVRGHAGNRWGNSSKS